MGLFVIAPKLAPCTQSITEVFGSAVWLWMHSERHRSAPVASLNELVMPPILHGQYVLMIEDGRPVAYMAWAAMDEVAERDYLTHARLDVEQQWVSGSRIWVTDAIAPFGHARALMRFMQTQLFANQWGRTLNHHGQKFQWGVKPLRGINVPINVAHKWYLENPPCWPG